MKGVEDTEKEGRSRDDGNGGEIGMVQFYYDRGWGNCNCINVLFGEDFVVVFMHSI
jgi:hypothetical protein